MITNCHLRRRPSFFSKYPGILTVSVLIAELLFSTAAVQADWKSEANDRIEQIRKRNAQITIVNSVGTPVPGLTVDINQVKHRFGFGTAIPYGLLSSNANYENFVIDHFEWAVCENVMKWSENESTRDEWTFSQPDYIANWCADNDIVLRGHTLVWETNQQTPSWVAGLPCATYPTTSEMLQEVDERINYTVGRYAGQIVSWDVDNEMLSGNMFDCLGEAGRAHFFQQANSIDPDCGFYMNEYSGNSFGAYDGNEYAARAQGLINLGAPVEGLGIQAHVASPFRPEDYYDDVLDELDDLGLPIIATEFDTDATNATQVADDLENFYRICFSHPSVEGIIMWGCEQSSWRWDGIVNSTTWILTEAGVRYESLLNEWTTSDANTSNASGQVGFRGFHGTYEITLSAPGQTGEVYTIEIEPGTTVEQFELETALESPEPDYDPPTPDPMTWLTPPTATGATTITMTATTASDISGVEYSFDCLTTGGHDSGWQDSSTYTDTGLNPNTQYTYRVQARDKSPNHNVTGWSSSLSATTEPPSTDVEILGSWVSGLTHAKEAGSNRGLIFIAHGELTSAMNLTAVTYGGQPMNKVVDYNYYSGSGSYAYAAAYILNEAGVAAATNNNFLVTWSPTTSEVKYASVFLQNVDQTTPVGATGTGGGTSNPVTTPALVTNDGDMVIDAATCGNTGTYTLQSGFTQGSHQSSGSSTGVTGYKSATGVPETPSASHTNISGNRQVIIGFVVKAVVPVNLPPAAPTGLNATPGNATVSLDWNNNGESDLAGYNVYRSTTSGSGYSKLNVSLVPDSNYNDNTAVNGTTYYYVVTAVDTISQESGYSNQASATPDLYQNCAQVQSGGDGLLSDLDGDCYVNYLDLDIVADYWLHTDCAELNNCEKGDFEPDGDVDFADFSTFSQQWMTCNDPENPADCPLNW